jgi:hypothetical protein
VWALYTVSGIRDGYRDALVAGIPVGLVLSIVTVVLRRRS